MNHTTMPSMKLLIATYLFTSISVLNTAAQKSVVIDSVSAYIGQNVTVCSKVYGTHVTNGEKPVTYLNLGAAYPDQKLTVVIFQKDRPNFPPSPEDYYRLKEVCVTGMLKLYKDKPEMILSDKSMISVTEH